MSLSIHIDWNNNGTYSTGVDQITTDVRVEEGVYIKRGRDAARVLSPTVAGKATFSLNSLDTGIHYWADNASTGRTIVPGRSARIRWGSTSIFTGNVDAYEFKPNLTEQHVKITALDGMEKLAQHRLSTPISSGIQTSDAINTILDSVGWSTSLRSIDGGQTFIPYWWAENIDALSAVEDLIAAEGPGAVAYVAGDGTFHFESRHYRLTQSRAITAQSTWQSSTEPHFGSIASFAFDKRDIINRVEVDVTRFEPQESTDVWTHSAGSVVVPSGSTQQFKVQAPSVVGSQFIGLTGFPALIIDQRAVSQVAKQLEDFSGLPSLNIFASAVDPTTEDYSVSVGSVASIGFDRQSGGSATLSIAASTTGDLVLSSLKARAVPLRQSDAFSVISEDTASQDKYGVLTYRLSTPWIADSNLAQDLADAIVARYKNPTRRLALSFDSASTARTDQQVGRAVSDRVTVVDGRSGLNDPFWVEAVEHDVIDGGKLLRTTFNVEEAVAGLVGSTDVFILNSTSQGILGTNKLGY